MTYNSDRSGELALWVRDTATRKEASVAKLSTGFMTPSVISPDESQVAFTVIEDKNNLYVVSTGGARPAS